MRIVVWKMRVRVWRAVKCCMERESCDADALLREKSTGLLRSEIVALLEGENENFVTVWFLVILYFVRKKGSRQTTERI